KEHTTRRSERGSPTRGARRRSETRTIRAEGERGAAEALGRPETGRDAPPTKKNEAPRPMGPRRLRGAPFPLRDPSRTALPNRHSLFTARETRATYRSSRGSTKTGTNSDMRALEPTIRTTIERRLA